LQKFLKTQPEQPDEFPQGPEEGEAQPSAENVEQNGEDNAAAAEAQAQINV